MSISSYIENISKRFSLGNATEHTFRGDLQQMLESLVPDIAATNEPKRIDCGAPDFVLTRNDIPVGYIEAKDIGVDLGGTVIKEQRERYVEALDNLIFTDYLEFRFFLDGTATERIRIGEVRGNKIVGFPDEFERFESLIKEFCFRTPQSIKSSKRLAEMMADKAKLLAYVIKNALDSDEETQENSTLKEQLYAFRQVLIHDIDSKQFSDVYAQTIAYGMFAARIHDSDLETFTRQEAAERIPKTNPFLRKLFQYIAGYDLDDRIRWIVDSLADVFRAADVAAILKNFGKSTQTHDPIIHFYETFLAEYDPKLRKSRGVYYTPEPVVDFIVRAVDDILKTEFGLPAGLADTSKVKVKEKTPVVKKGKGTVYEEVEKEYHKVQILDPATGTGTFLAQVIKQIYKSFENQKGIWPQYVEEHLIPRLNGFELLMASYAMAHLKLDLLLTELSADTSLKGTNIIAQGKGEARDPGNAKQPATDPEGVEQTAADVAPLQGANANADISPGFHPGLSSSSLSGTRQQRFRIYLTNSLEEYHPETGTLWASWLSTEANEANHIKRDTPVMVVIGNPPYSVSSSNKSEWIEDLMIDYKKDLDERNINPLSDDYLKFIRFGEHFIAKNGEGILAYITNNSFINGVIHRQVRKQLLESFDSIYIVNLHGNSAQHERSPDGSVDENVFDIKQGVSISILVKSGMVNHTDGKKISYCDFFGMRQSKYANLLGSTLGSIRWDQIVPKSPDYFFFPLNHVVGDDYKKGFSVEEVFPVGASGIKTERDSLAIQFSESEIVQIKNDLVTSDVEGFRVRYREKPDGRDWKLGSAKKDLQDYGEGAATMIQYRPFDVRYTFYTGRIKGIHAYPRGATMRHMFSGENIALLVGRQNKSGTVDSVFVTKLISLALR